MRIYKKIQSIYNRSIREGLPHKNRSLSGVAVHDTPLLDIHADNERYKIGFIMSFYDYVSEGDKVEIVGFGRGVTTTHMLRAGASQVVGYEAAPNMITKGIDTVKRNIGHSRSIDIRHAVVGDPIDIYGDSTGAEVVSPGELSNADCLVLDCEGAEISILSELGTYPETIICESHPNKGAPATKIVNILDEQYTVYTRKHKPRYDAKQVVIGTKSQ